MYGEIGYYSDRRTVKSRTVGKYAYTHSGIAMRTDYQIGIIFNNELFKFL